AQINDHLDDAEEYGLKLLKLLDENYDSIKEVIVLNALTSIYRQKGDYPQALKYADRVIKLCQKYGLKDKVVLNLINYGNVLRDDNQLEQALNIYNEALVVAKEYKLKKEEGRIYWILAGIERSNHQYNKSIEYADKSITINKSVNFYYGVANAYREKSETLILKDSKIEAAVMLEESAEFYLKIEYFASSYQSKLSEAIKLYKEEGKSDDVNRVLNKLICNTSKKLKYDKLSELILDTTNSNTETILENFYKVFEHHFKENNSSNLTLIFLDYLVFCQGVESNKGKSAFIKSLNLILDHLSVAKFSFSLLAIAIEQSRDLLDFNDINYINQRLQDVLPFYNFRILGEECILMTSINQSINLEIHLCNDELICLKLTMMIVLFLNENPDLMANNKDKLEKYCKICLFCDSVELRDVIVNNSGEVVNHFSENTQSLHLEKKDYKTEEFIIIGEDFSKFSNFNTFSDNKVSLYFLVMTLAGIKGQLYHEDIKNNAKNRIEILHSVAKLFDYNQNKAVGENNQSAYNIDFGSFHK
ncbi:MAG: tetratricopeptide repeat protein, partial [Marinifilaceae bacterium]